MTTIVAFMFLVTAVCYIVLFTIYGFYFNLSKHIFYLLLGREMTSSPRARSSSPAGSSSQPTGGPIILNIEKEEIEISDDEEEVNEDGSVQSKRKLTSKAWQSYLREYQFYLCSMTYSCWFIIFSAVL
jgi:hypothetical protein